MRYPGLNKKELSELQLLTGQIFSHPNGDIAKKLRQSFFHPKQKIVKIRYWFDKIPQVTLNNDELKIIRKIVVKPKSTEWSVIKNIIKFQQQLTGDEVVEWFKELKPSERNPVSIYFIMDKRVKDVDFKVELVKELLDHYNYQRPIIQTLDDELSLDYDGFWEKVFYLVVGMINENDTRSKRMAEIWANETNFLNLYALHRDISSFLLYEFTGLEQYLPKVAKDVFLF